MEKDLFDLLNALMEARNIARALGQNEIENKIQDEIEKVAYTIDPNWDNFIKPLEWW